MAMFQKFVPEVVNGTATGKFVKADATVLDVLNPTVPLDDGGSIARTIGAAVLARVLA